MRCDTYLNQTPKNRIEHAHAVALVFDGSGCGACDGTRLAVFPPDDRPNLDEADGTGASVNRSQGSAAVLKQQQVLFRQRFS